MPSFAVYHIRMFRSPAPISLTRAIEVFGLAFAYFACAALTLQLTRFGGGVAIVWPAGAVLFAKLVASPRHRWSLLVLSCLPAGVLAAAMFGFGRGVAVPLACISVGEAFAAAWLLKRVCRRIGRFQSIGEVSRFLAIAGALIPATGAVLGGWLAHYASGIPLRTAALDWYAGHALGLIALAPPLVLMFRGNLSRWRSTASRHDAFEAVGLLGAVAGACAVTFGQNDIPLVMLPLLPMIAATFRLGRFGAVASVVLLMSIGMGCSLAGLGPTTLLAGAMGVKLQVLQVYFATVVLILLPIAAELKARRRLTERLKAAETLHRLVLDRTGDIVMRLGVDGTIRYASPSVIQASGYTAEELNGRSALDLVHVDDLPMVIETRTRALAAEDQRAVAEYRVIRKDGSVSWVESHMRATIGDDGRVTGTVSIVREINERRKATEALTQQAITDPLTGLGNRRAFDVALADRLAAVGSGSAVGCLALFDLDHFKRVNDQHGHATGDEVLRGFAQLLQASIRDGDLAVRLGGEEFAILLGGATPEQAHLVCDRIRQRLASTEMRSAAGEPVRVTVSAGLSPLAASIEPAELLARTDTALYRAKHEGRNRLALVA